MNLIIRYDTGQCEVVVPVHYVALNSASQEWLEASSLKELSLTISASPAPPRLTRYDLVVTSLLWYIY